MGQLPNTIELEALNQTIARALKARHESGKAGIAAGVLLDGEMIATGENEVSLRSDPTKHAEMVALTAAAKHLGTTDLSGCVLLSTLQPCEMCLSAMRFAGIKKVIYAATQANVAEKYFVFPRLRLEDFKRAGEAFEAIGGVRESEVLHLYVDGDE